MQTVNRQTILILRFSVVLDPIPRRFLHIVIATVIFTRCYSDHSVAGVSSIAGDYNHAGASSVASAK